MTDLLLVKILTGPKIGLFDLPDDLMEPGAHSDPLEVRAVSEGMRCGWVSTFK